jgi:hypothetical protein
MIGITIAIVMTGTITIGMIRTITIGTICTIGTNEFFPLPLWRESGAQMHSPARRMRKMAGPACLRDEHKILQSLQDSPFSDAGRSPYIPSKSEAGRYCPDHPFGRRKWKLRNMLSLPIFSLSVSISQRDPTEILFDF